MTMDWTAAVDAYCERMGPGFWAEPLNAVTNLAFLVSAFVLWRQVRHRPDLPLALLLTGILAAIGVGSFLFHTFATRWAGVADTAPILIFVLVFTFATAHDLMKQPLLYAAAITLGFFPFTALVAQAAPMFPWLGSSAGYLPILLWLAGFAVMASGKLAWDLWTATALLAMSLFLRTLDEPMCSQLPIGTHFLWHCLNALLLGWLIATYLRNHPGPGPTLGQPLAKPGPQS